MNSNDDIIIIKGDENECYEVDTSQRLGKGGCGQVFRGMRIDEFTGEPKEQVAIKFLFDDLPEEMVERARDEAKMNVFHENLLRMYSFVELEDNQAPGVIHYHVVSEYIDGVRLHDIIHSRLPDRYPGVSSSLIQQQQRYLNDRVHFSAEVLLKILAGIGAMHKAGYIHRDLAPSNIMLSSSNQLKIIDFGIAKKLGQLKPNDHPATAQGCCPYTPDYAAPELCTGSVTDLNFTTDIYAVGIILFELLTGHVPFKGDRYQIAHQQMHASLPLNQVNIGGAVGRSMRGVIRKATAKRQRDRYQTADEMAAAIEAALHPVPWSDILHWTAILLGGLLLMVGGLLAGLYIF